MVTCLVVDQSAIVRRILGVMLTRLGIASCEADSVESALALCAESLPDLALIDWNLPDADGITLVGHLRRLPGGERIKLILCTIERSVTQIETALGAGADEYITKPFGIEVLETKLGYLGFDLSTDSAAEGSASLRLRRNFSRVGLAGMSVAEGEEARFAAGEVIFQPGDAPDFAYILLSGRVELTGCTADHAAVTLVHTPFDLFGELALVENTPRPMGARALTDCSTMRISRQRFQAELASLSPFMRNWIESLSDHSSRLFMPSADNFSREGDETD